MFNILNLNIKCYEDIKRKRKSYFQRAVGRCEAADELSAVSYRSRISEIRVRDLGWPRNRPRVCWNLRVVFLIKKTMSGGTVVNNLFDHPAEIISLRDFFI